MPMCVSRKNDSLQERRMSPCYESDCCSKLYAVDGPHVKTSQRSKTLQLRSDGRLLADRTNRTIHESHACLPKSELRSQSLNREGHKQKKCTFTIKHIRKHLSRSVKPKSPVYRIKKPRGGYEPYTVMSAPLTESTYRYDTYPVQAEDLNGPSLLIAESQFSKDLPYAFMVREHTTYVPTYRYPQYRDKPSRVRTFSQNSCRDLDPTRFAAAGFFYTGPGDLVRCFWCGVGFKDWTPHDNPWYQHIKLSRDCGFPASAISPEELHAYKVIRRFTGLS